jgi:hypothetical protein
MPGRCRYRTALRFGPLFIVVLLSLAEASCGSSAHAVPTSPPRAERPASVGVPEVDAVLRAVNAKDVDYLSSHVDLTARSCTLDPNAHPQRPLCGGAASESTLVPAATVGECARAVSGRDDLAVRLSTIVGSATFNAAVVYVSNPSSQVQTDYVVVLTPSGGSDPTHPLVIGIGSGRIVSFERVCQTQAELTFALDHTPGTTRLSLLQ